MTQIIGNHSELPAPESDLERWRPIEHRGKLHLVLSSGRVQATPNSRFGQKDTSVADLIVVFDEASKEITIYQDPWLGQKWFRVRLDQSGQNPQGGGALAGVLTQKQFKSGANPAWMLDDCTQRQYEIVSGWMKDNVEGDNNVGFTLSKQQQQTTETNLDNANWQTKEIAAPAANDNEPEPF